MIWNKRATIRNIHRRYDGRLRRTEWPPAANVTNNQGQAEKSSRTTDTERHARETRRREEGTAGTPMGRYGAGQTPEASETSDSSQIQEGRKNEADTMGHKKKK